MTFDDAVLAAHKKQLDKETTEAPSHIGEDASSESFGTSTKARASKTSRGRKKNQKDDAAFDGQYASNPFMHGNETVDTNHTMNGNSIADSYNIINGAGFTEAQYPMHQISHPDVVAPINHQPSFNGASKMNEQPLLGHLPLTNGLNDPHIYPNAIAVNPFEAYTNRPPYYGPDAMHDTYGAPFAAQHHVLAPYEDQLQALTGPNGMVTSAKYSSTHADGQINLNYLNNATEATYGMSGGYDQFSYGAGANDGR